MIELSLNQLLLSLKQITLLLSIIARTTGGENWEYLLNKPIYINEEDCYDLSRLTSEGAESHIVEFDESLNDEWKPHAIKYLGTNHIKDESHTLSLVSYASSLGSSYLQSPDDLVKIIPQNNEDWIEVWDIISKLGPRARVYRLFDASEVYYEPSDIKITGNSYIDGLPNIKYDDTKKYTLYNILTIRNLFIDKHVNTIQECSSKKLIFDPECKLEKISNIYGATEIVIPPMSPNCRDIRYYRNMYYSTNNVKKVDLSGFPQDRMPPMTSTSSGYESDRYQITSSVTVENQHFDYIEIQAGKNYSYGILGQHTVGVVNVPYKYLRTSSKAILHYTGVEEQNDQTGADYPYISGQYTRYYIFAVCPTSVAAVPVRCYSILYSSFPNSDSVLWWVDNATNDGLSVKQITKRKPSIDIPITTFAKSGTIEFELPKNLLEPVDDYPYTFQLDSILDATYDATFSGDVSLSNFSYNSETGKCSIDADGIADDKTGTIKIANFYLFYKAIIDSHDFHGTALFKNFNINLQFTIDEDVNSTISIVSDDEAAIDPLPCYVVLPTADEKTAGKKIVYKGESDDNFEKDAVYICVMDNDSYIWQKVE